MAVILVWTAHEHDHLGAILVPLAGECHTSRDQVALQRNFFAALKSYAVVSVRRAAHWFCIGISGTTSLSPVRHLGWARTLLHYRYIRSQPRAVGRGRSTGKKETGNDPSRADTGASRARAPAHLTRGD